MSENSKECLANSHCQKKVSCDSKILMWHTVPPWHAPQGHKLHGVHWQSAPYGQIGLQSGATGATWNSAISSQVHYLHYQFKICGFPTNLSKSHSTLWELAARTQASEKLPAKAACGKTCKRSHISKASWDLRVPDPWVQIDQRHAHVRHRSAKRRNLHALRPPDLRFRPPKRPQPPRPQPSAAPAPRHRREAPETLPASPASGPGGASAARARQLPRRNAKRRKRRREPEEPVIKITNSGFIESL